MGRTFVLIETIEEGGLHGKLSTRDDTNITQTSIDACKRLSRFERAVVQRELKADFIFLRDGGRREHVVNFGKCDV